MKKFIEKGNQFVEVYFNILIVFTVFYCMHACKSFCDTVK